MRLPRPTRRILFSSRSVSAGANPFFALSSENTGCTRGRRGGAKRDNAKSPVTTELAESSAVAPVNAFRSERKSK